MSREIERELSTRTGVSRIAAGPDNGCMDPIDAERFWSFVDQTAGIDACWPWTGGRSYMGYGLFYVTPTQRLTASRRALILKLGRELLPQRVTCHTCDNPPCCNPAHLYEGTYSQNRADFLARGR